MARVFLRSRALGLAAFSALRMPILVGILLLAAAGPVFIGAVPPLADYANHLARMDILARLPDDPLLQAVYRVEWGIIPNLAMDAVVPPLARAIGVMAAGQLFTFGVILALVTGPMAVHRAVYGRVTVAPLFAFLFAYNGMLLYGLMNYLAGISIAMWGLALWIALRDRSPWLRMASAVPVVMALFFCHLFAVGLFGLAVSCFEMVQGPRAWRWRALVPVVPPFLPVPLLMAASPTMGLSSDVLWEAHGKMDGLYSIVQLYGDVPDLLFGAAILSGAAWLQRRRVLGLHPAGWAILALGGVVYLALPRVLFGSWLADQRMPVAILFFVLGFLRPIDLPVTARSALLAGVVALVGLRYADVQWHWRTLDAAIGSVAESTGLIAPGGSVLVAHADVPEGDLGFQQALSHAPCLAAVRRDAVVSTLFSVRGKQVLDLRPPYRDRVDAEDGDPPTVSQMLAAPSAGRGERYWDGWPQKYQYVYILYTAPGEENPDPARLQLLRDGIGFQLYAIVQD